MKSLLSWQTFWWLLLSDFLVNHLNTNWLPSLTITYTSNQSNLSVHSLFYAEACNEFAGLICASLRPDNIASFEEIAAVASRWHHCVRFDRLEIWMSDLPLQRWTRYRLTKWLVCNRHWILSYCKLTASKWFRWFTQTPRTYKQQTFFLRICLNWSGPGKSAEVTGKMGRSLSPSWRSSKDRFWWQCCGDTKRNQTKGMR